MKWIDIVLIAALLVQVGYVPCLAEESATPKGDQFALVLGAWIRIKAPSVSDRQLVGALVAVGADTLVLRSKEQSMLLVIPVASVARLDVSRGMQRRYGRGAVLGLVSGAGLGFFLGLASGDDEPGAFMSLTGGEKAMLLAIPLGLFGLLVGTLIGATVESDIWQPVPLDRIRVGILSQRHGGPVLSASFSF